MEGKGIKVMDKTNGLFAIIGVLVAVVVGLFFKGRKQSSLSKKEAQLEARKQALKQKLQDQGVNTESARKEYEKLRNEIYASSGINTISGTSTSTTTDKQ